MDRSLLRIIDANANRASEAARVLEDSARLGLGDAQLAWRGKEIRHKLRSALSFVDSSSLLAARDTPGDVGTGMTGSTEARRSGLTEICAAAGKRLGEALRVLEETLKAAPIDGPAAAATIKALRYEAYELEKLVVLAVSRPRRQWKLCVLITESLCTHMLWEEVARAAIRGGADCLQLREKMLTGQELFARAKRLVAIAAETPIGNRGADAKADVIINDRADIAGASGAAGVHLGQADLPVTAARAVLGPRQIIGVSTSCIDDARRAFDNGADYVGLGPMFASSTKVKERLAGIEYLREFLAWDNTRTAETGGPPVPYLAISGIDVSRAGQLASAGCAGVAVSSVVCSSTEPERVCSEIVRAMDAAHA